MKTCTSFLKPSGKSGPDRAVDDARREDLVIVRPTFALDEAAGNLAGGVGLLLVLDGEREERQRALLSLTVTAASTIVSPNWTTAEPAACFAIRPVSMRRRRPAKVRSTRCIIARSGLGRTQNARVAKCAPARLVTTQQLVAESKFLDELPVRARRRCVQVRQEAAPLADHLQQPTAAVMVLGVRTKM